LLNFRDFVFIAIYIYSTLHYFCYISYTIYINFTVHHAFSGTLYAICYLDNVTIFILLYWCS